MQVPLLMIVAESVRLYVWSLLYEDVTWINALLMLPLPFILAFFCFLYFAILFLIPE